MERMKSKINGFEPYIQNTNSGGAYTGIDEFKKDYQPSINLVKDENISHLQFPIVHWIVEESRPLVAEYTYCYWLYADWSKFFWAISARA